MVKENLYEEVKEKVELGLRDRLQYLKLPKENPGHVIKIEQLIKYKKVSKGVEIEDGLILGGVGDPIGESISQLVESLLYTLEDVKVIDYEVEVEIGRDTDRRATLVYVDVIYTVPVRS